MEDMHIIYDYIYVEKNVCVNVLVFHSWKQGLVLMVEINGLMIY